MPRLAPFVLALTMLGVACQSPAPASTPSAAQPTAVPTRAARQPLIDPQTYVEGVALPTGLTFAPDGRLFFVEVNKGLVRVASNGMLQAEPFATLKVATGAEHGVLGLTLDPRFSDNGYVYVYYTVPKKSGKPDANRVVRFTDRDGKGTDERILIDEIPVDVKGSHNGGRLRFGPDGKLYITTGAPGDEGNDAQKLDVLEGKILRLNSDGSVPADNPFPGSPVYAFGFRNPYGLDFHPQTGRPFVVDNGPRGYDELNLVIAGGNYGSPDVVGSTENSRFVDPLWDSGTERLGVVGLTFYNGSQFPEYRDDLFHCLWNPGLLRRVRLAGPTYDRIETAEEIAVDCRLDVATGPDGALYVASINRILRLGRT